MSLNIEQLKYPIGKFSYDESSAQKMTNQWIKDIAYLPRRLSDLVYPLTKEQLNTPYRKGSWTVLQLIHHLADSHINGYVRMKVALTEDNPAIKTYDQDEWAKLPDYKTKMDDSMELIYGLHKRWARILHTLKPDQLERTFQHPESGTWTVRKLIALYAWHSNHHLAHIRTLKEQKNW
ncbi:MAG TPA: putative metal-dependent hydrolase [Balneolaceae bacterium]|nr:putative metal-dependent hydrolase [Balneolaceae bacterium]